MTAITSFSSEISHRITTEEPTDEQVAKLVDKKPCSYAEARMILGCKQETDLSDDIVSPEASQSGEPMESVNPGQELFDIESGPSLSLVGRAKALDVIMGMFNQHSKAIGAGLSRGHNDMENRYGYRTDEVIENMYEKTHRLGKQALRALQVLSDGDSGIGVPPEVDYRHSIKRDLEGELGPGQAHVSDREKLLTKAFKAAGTTKAGARRSRR